MEPKRCCEGYDPLREEPYAHTRGRKQCTSPAVLTRYRVDIRDNRGTRLCMICVADTDESGLYGSIGLRP